MRSLKLAERGSGLSGGCQTGAQLSVAFFETIGGFHRDSIQRQAASARCERPNPRVFRPSAGHHKGSDSAHDRPWQPACLAHLRRELIVGCRDRTLPSSRDLRNFLSVFTIAKPCLICGHCPCVSLRRSAIRSKLRLNHPFPVLPRSHPASVRASPKRGQEACRAPQAL